MSIIGTRPPLISETNFYELHHRARLAIKPGITGMWQVSGRSDITDFEEVVRLDKEYITDEFISKLTSKKISDNLDPVLIYDFSNEVNKVKKLPKLPEHYCIIYSYYNRIHKPEEIDTIKRFCDKYNLTPIAIGAPQFWLKNYVACSPFQCLKIFQNADFVITDTFHGTIFAAKYAPKYAVLIRDSNKNKLLDLIKKIKIENHLIENMEEIEEKFSCKKDIVGFQKIIEMERRKTSIYLEQEIRRQKD